MSSIWYKFNEEFLKLAKQQIESLTAYAEARGESLAGQQAVISVIRNRVLKNGWFVDREIAAGSTPTHGVCLKKYQFSCYLQADPNRVLLASMARTSWDLNMKADKILKAIYDLTMDPELKDNTDGATMYYSTSMKLPPEWAKEYKKTVQIGHHIFFK